MMKLFNIIDNFFIPYSFNGMEKDNEVKGEGNSYNFGARMLDPRVGRWLAVDPKGELFTSQSRYIYSANCPIYYIDNDGNTITPSNEKSKQDFNTTVQNVFSNNEIARNIFSISGENTALSNITMEDYSAALNATESIDERAVIRTLYLAANSEIDYQLYSMEQKETVSSGEFKRSTEEVEMAQGYTDYRVDERTVQIFISLNQYTGGDNLYAPVGKPRNNGNLFDNTIRDADAMVIGAIGAVYLDNDFSVVGSSMDNTFMYRGDKQLSAIQLENTVMRLKGMSELSGNDFKRPNGEFISGEPLDFVHMIPNQITYQFEDYVYHSDVLVNQLTGASTINQSEINRIDSSDTKHPTSREQRAKEYGE